MLLIAFKDLSVQILERFACIATHHKLHIADPTPEITIRQIENPILKPQAANFKPQASSAPF
jgi:hypothetical protein